MAPRQSKSKPPVLKVVFDTNALFTRSGSALLSEQVSTIIRQPLAHTDLQITWCLPETVLHERQYQMETACLELLPYIGKLERVLRHNLNTTEDILKTRIKENVHRQIGEANIQVLALDAGQVEWDRLIHDAVYRHPPFERGSTEKGFRCPHSRDIPPVGWAFTNNSKNLPTGTRHRRRPAL
jgi:hypothetical protein